MWEEEIAYLQYKRATAKVRTAAGVEKYDAPVGTPIVAGVAVPVPKKKPGKKPAAKAPAPAKTGKGGGKGSGVQTRSTFVHPATGHTMGKTEVGDTFEQLFQAKMRKGLEREFGCCLRLITGAGQGTARNTALDFSLGGKPPHGGEVKTLNARATNQKTAIKKEEIARKVAAVSEMGAKPLLVVQVVDQDAGVVRVYAHPAFESKAVTRMTPIGEYRFDDTDFEAAQKAAGHWEKAEKRAADEKAKKETKADKKPAGDAGDAGDLAALGSTYDPPDEEGGVIEPGDTVIQLKEVDGEQVPFIYTFPDENGEEDEEATPTEKKSAEGDEDDMDRATVVNEDWIKATWDVWLGTQLVKTMDQLKEYCDRQRMTLSHFMSLPAAEAMPAELKEEMDLWRQERMAELLDQAKVDDPVGQLLEAKGIIKRVRSREGKEKYGEEIGEIIKPDIVPNIPRTSHSRSSTSQAASGSGGGGSGKWTDIGPDDGSRETKYGGLPQSQRGNRLPITAGAHYGTYKLDDFIAFLNRFEAWTNVYKAGWLGGDTLVDVVRDHDQISGGRERAFQDGAVRVAISKSPDGQFRNPNFQIRGKVNRGQAEAMKEMFEELGATSSTISVERNERGEGEPLNGEWTFHTAQELYDFLMNPSVPPKKRENAERMAIYAQFLKVMEELGIEVKEEDGLFWEVVDFDLHTDWDEKAGVRRVRTPEGARRFDQAIGTIIRPDGPDAARRKTRRGSRGGGRGGGESASSRTSGVLAALDQALNPALTPKQKKQLDEDNAALAAFEHDEARPQLEWLFRTRREVEPEVTGALEATVIDNGGRMEGLDFRFKGSEKVNEKIDRYIRGQGRTPQVATEKIADALRYTAEFEVENYARGVAATIAALQARGFTWLEVENHWPKGDSYNGINAVLVHPSGMKVELQFHTPESFDVKQNQNHTDYEWFREEPKQGTREERLAVFNRMMANADAITFPPGWEGIGELVLHPFNE